MYAETQLLLLSGLQHLQFCRRQWALIHLEQVWSENQFTAEGRNLHDKVHDSDIESRGDVRIVRGLRLQCLRLGLVLLLTVLYALAVGPGENGSVRFV